MPAKLWITIGLIVGSTLGSYLPVLWGDSLLSLTSVILTFVGGVVGVWLGYKMSQMYS